MSKTAVRMLGGTAIILVVLLTLLGTHLYFEGRPAQGRPQYVAMGSSFAAGPAITTAADDSPWFCGRSRDNYAHQLARLRNLALVDVSCSGATTRHVLEGGQFMQPAQLDAVTAQTELVTITIGGNDIGYIGTLMAMACDDDTAWLRRQLGGCRVRSVQAMQQGLTAVHERLLAIVDAVRHRAPGARIVLVNYQTVLPEQGRCERLDLTESQVTSMRGVATQLAETTQAAADAGGALLLDARSLSQHHDVCASTPWMKGMHPPGGLMGAPLHPTIEGMTAIAQALDALLGPVPQ